jgi:enamine deaminase RidA (YjgF/YER057c/UK114 family)
VQLKAFMQPMDEVSVAQGAITEFFEGAMVPPMVFVHWTNPGAPIEIEAIVAAPASQAGRSITHLTPPGSRASPVFSRLARIHSGRRIYISGLYGTSEARVDVADIFQRLDAILARTGSSREHLVKATYYYSDPESNARLDAFRPKYYQPTSAPAASKARVPHVGLPGKGIMIDLIAGTK